MWKQSSLLILCTLLASCQFTDLRAIFLNNRTSKMIKEKSVDESQMGYLQALEMEPLLPAVHSNLGATYDTLKDPDKALKLYKNAEEFSKAEMQELGSQNVNLNLNKNSSLLSLFVSLFNQGQLLARENKLDDALAKYQEALAIVPTSKEVKTNIELLMQQKQGGGKGESKEDKDKKDKDKNDKGKDGKDKNEDEEKDKKGEKPKDYNSSPKYKPREFKGELNKENVQKIFGEISQQEKKMRAQFSKQKQTKESPREKDW